MMNPTPKYIYEAQNTTDDQTYYTVGVYSSLKRAIEDALLEKPDECENESLFEISIFKRELDKPDCYNRKVALIKFERCFKNDDDNDGFWTVSDVIRFKRPQISAQR